MESCFRTFCGFFEIFLLRRVYRCASCRHKRHRTSTCSHSETASKWLQMPSVMELVGHGAWKRDEENPGVEDGGVRRRRRERGTVSLRAGQEGEAQSCRVMCLSLARRYNTLDLAGKVSVPRGCGPFGNPGEEGRRRPGRRNGNFPFGAATVVRFGMLLFAEGSCSLAEEIGAAFGVQGSGARHFLRRWYYPP